MIGPLAFQTLFCGDFMALSEYTGLRFTKRAHMELDELQGSLPESIRLLKWHRESQAIVDRLLRELGVYDE